MNWLGRRLQRYVGGTDMVLNLGCGIMNAADGLNCKCMLGCDIWPAYLDVVKDRRMTITMRCEESERFVDFSYDIVMCLDTIEHLEREPALKLLDEMKRICRKKAIVYTPGIFEPNTQPDGGAWGLGENPYQLHKCVITKEELEEHGYEVIPIADNNLGVFYK